VRQILWGIFDQDNHRSSIAITAESTNNNNNYDNNNATTTTSEVKSEYLFGFCEGYASQHKRNCNALRSGIKIKAFSLWGKLSLAAL